MQRWVTMYITMHCSRYNEIINSNALNALDQNNPNPFSNITTISYNLPQNFTAAQIILTDKSDKTLKQVTVSGSGKGTIHIDAATLSAGAYNYSLLVDGKLIATRQMSLIK